MECGARKEIIRRKRGREEGERALTPTPPPGFLFFFFAAHISLRCPHDLNAWKRLGNLGGDRLIEVRLIKD